MATGLDALSRSALARRDSADDPTVSTMMQRSRDRRQGFTITELLVVIA
ncbi:MAG: prepilin-type N-terminal cleavage/methylation domain-containing protein, partial [Phycisphaerales bacterium]|nr:prepilin-type N-terminal cleavage/methylation domain-containing protein [Phycisphaerales bacterium]